MLLLRTLAIIIFVILFAWLFFSLAGRWDWLAGWGTLALLFLCGFLSDLTIWLKDPELAMRRAKYGEGTKSWDIVCLALFALTLCLMLVVGALDRGHYGWSTMPAWLWPVGAALYVFGHTFTTWAMLTNTHFEKTARIQKDRDHKVIDTGPYAYVRHPGYIAIIIAFCLGVPLMLGSWWAFAPALATALILIIRTYLEDRMLRTELQGYEAYAARVRYRLIPGLW